MHKTNGLTESFVNPILLSITPNAGALTQLYNAPGAPLDTEMSVLRICNTTGGDQTFSVAFATAANPTPVYVEYATEICANQALDLFNGPAWLPPTTQIWVMSAGGGVTFTILGSQVASETATPNFTGS